MNRRGFLAGLLAVATVTVAPLVWTTRQARSALYKAGDQVPRDWFLSSDRTTRMVFGSDVEVHFEDGRRVVTATSNGDCVIEVSGGGEIVFEPHLVVTGRRAALYLS